jgi:hypothetical protein
MQYENLFWGMATVVMVAIIGGALLARVGKVVHSLAGCAALAAVNGIVAAYLTRDGAFADQSAILTAGAVMFTLVIATASTLAMRRLLRHHQ